MPDINSLLSTEDIDVIGEIANISIGTGAVALNKLIGVPIKINTTGTLSSCCRLRSNKERLRYVFDIGKNKKAPEHRRVFQG